MVEFILLRDLVVPAGTKLSGASNERGGQGSVEAIVAMGKDSFAWLNMPVSAVKDAPPDLITAVEF
jgi:hypothetical protein